MKFITASLMGAALCCSSLQANATLIDVTGMVSASGFLNRPSGFIGSPVLGPYGQSALDPLEAEFALTYDDVSAPSNGTLDVALTSFMLDIGPASYDANNSSAVLTFDANMMLIGVTVAGDANGGPTISVPDTDDFVFSVVDGTQNFLYTAAGFPAGPAPLAGVFETLSTPGTNIGDVSVVFSATPPQAVPLPATSLLLVSGLGLLAAKRRRRGEAE